MKGGNYQSHVVGKFFVSLFRLLSKVEAFQFVSEPSKNIVASRYVTWTNHSKYRYGHPNLDYANTGIVVIGVPRSVLFVQYTTMWKFQEFTSELNIL